MPKLVYPLACAHCGNSIAQQKPVGRQMLDAALMVLRGSMTARSVAAALSMDRNTASNALCKAEKAGLIKLAYYTSSPTGGKIKHYYPAKRLRGFFPAEWDQFHKINRSAAA